MLLFVFAVISNIMLFTIVGGLCQVGAQGVSLLGAAQLGGRPSPSTSPSPLHLFFLDWQWLCSMV